MIKLLIPILCLALIAGCVSSEQTTRQETTPQPTEEPTLVSPMIHPTVGPTKTGYITVYATQTPDPIVGGWQLVGAPYKCNAIFANTGNGNIDCGIFPVSQQRNIQWEKYEDFGCNTTYHIAMENTQGIILSTIQCDGTMISDILPNGSVLVKNQ